MQEIHTKGLGEEGRRDEGRQGEEEEETEEGAPNQQKQGSNTQLMY